MRSIGNRCTLVALLFSTIACAGGDAGETDANATGDAPAPSTASSDPARVEIVEPQDGAELQDSIVNIVLAAHDITIAPAGDSTPNSGHHHLFVNATPVEAGQPIPIGLPEVVHLGKAQTSHQLTGLKPGEYTVIAVIGDLLHRRVDPQVSDTVRFRIR